MYTQENIGIFHMGTEGNNAAGCSKRLSSKVVASKEARRTLRHVEPLNDTRTKLADFFSILLGETERMARGGEELHDLGEADRKSTRLNSSHLRLSRMPSSA